MMANDGQNNGIGKPCIAFELADPKEAYDHLNYELVEDYGDYAYGHYLHTWDDGHRFLARCRGCGGYILIQCSEYHSFTDAPDGYYTDWFPVKAPEEADMLNQKFDGFAIEREFEGRYLMETNGKLSWSR